MIPNKILVTTTADCLRRRCIQVPRFYLEVHKYFNHHKTTREAEEYFQLVAYRNGYEACYIISDEGWEQATAKRGIWLSPNP